MKVTPVEAKDPAKKKLRALLWFFHKVVADAESVRADNQHAGSPVVRTIQSSIESVSNDVKSPYHRRFLQELMELALWIYYKDTAYRDQIDTILSRIIDSGIRDDLDPPPPEDWFVNVYQDGIDKDANMRLNGYIDESEVSDLAAATSNTDYVRKLVRELRT